MIRHGLSHGSALSIVGLLAVFIVGGCGVKPEGRGGQCELKCSKAVIGSNRLRIKPINDGTVTVQCAGEFTETKPLDGPILVQFVAYDEVGKDYRTGEPRRVPVSNISIEPLVTGLMDGEATNAELREGSSSAAYRYSGIVTSSDEWCSDACGVISLEVQPVCVSGATNEVSVQIHSGSLYSPKVPIQVKHQDNG
jgi:hypothetical protein